MIEDVETIPLRGRRVTWTGDNETELRDLAGERVLDRLGTSIIVVSQENREWLLEPGWTVIVWETGEITVSSHSGQPWLRRPDRQ